MRIERLAAFGAAALIVSASSALPIGCSNETFGNLGPDATADAPVASDASDGAASCPAGRADCDGNLANGCETDLMIDPAHCGKCARDCEGTLCATGFCDPSFVAAFQVAPTVIAADDTGVYWVNGATAYERRLLGVLQDGGSPAPGATALDGGGFVLASNFVGPSALALSASTVYVADPWGSPSTAGSIFAVLKSAPCDAARTATTDAGPACFSLTGNTQVEPLDIAISGAGNIFWTNFGSLPSPELEGSVWISKPEASGEPLFKVTEGARGISVFGKYVYWSARGINGYAHTNLVARRVIADSDCSPPAPGCPPEVMFDSLGGEVGDVAVDATGVYVTNLALSTVVHGPLNGGPASALTVLAGNQSRITSIVMDDRDLYWMRACSAPGASDGAIATMPKVGCAASDETCVRVVRGNLRCPGGIALDENHVYFTTTDDGVIWRVVK